MVHDAIRFRKIRIFYALQKFILHLPNDLSTTSVNVVLKDQIII